MKVNPDEPLYTLRQLWGAFNAGKKEVMGGDDVGTCEKCYWFSFDDGEQGQDGGVCRFNPPVYEVNTHKDNGDLLEGGTRRTIVAKNSNCSKWKLAPWRVSQPTAPETTT
jgi:hypothetical protein